MLWFTPTRRHMLLLLLYLLAIDDHNSVGPFREAVSGRPPRCPAERVRWRLLRLPRPSPGGDNVPPSIPSTAATVLDRSSSASVSRGHPSLLGQAPHRSLKLRRVLPTRELRWIFRCSSPTFWCVMLSAPSSLLVSCRRVCLFLEECKYKWCEERRDCQKRRGQKDRYFFLLFCLFSNSREFLVVTWAIPHGAGPFRFCLSVFYLGE